MKLPNKFWFYDKSDSSEIFFARKIGDYYTITVPNKESCVHFEDEVEECFNLGLFVLTVPDKFCVRGTRTGREYPIIKDANDLYVLKNQVTGNVFYGREEVLEYLYGISPLWEILENTAEKPAQESPLKRLININVNDVRAAAEFDVANNPHTKAKGNTVEEIEREILGYLKEMYDALMSGDTEWELQYTGTRTYRILLQPEDDHYGTISILSDTSVGMPTFFADINDFLSQN